ncbi:hypothetical protein R3I93_006712 [Phoxinus phoxinus]
MNQVY